MPLDTVGNDVVGEEVGTLVVGELDTVRLGENVEVVVVGETVGVNVGEAVGDAVVPHTQTSSLSPTSSQL